MNIQYHIDSETGLMNLKFQKNILDPLGDKKEIFEKYILSMLTMYDKFVLTGSLSLKLLGFEPIEHIGDFDLGLTEPFTEEDYLYIKNFFDLNDSRHGYNWDEKPVKDIKFDPNTHMWQLFKSWSEEVDEDLSKHLQFKLDIFNDEILRKKDIITINYGDFPVKLIHPSITLSYRMRYALDIRSSTSFKYFSKMKDFMKDPKPYYNQVRLLSKMVSRVAEHNANIEDDKNKLNYLKDLIYRRERNADDFYNNAFNVKVG